MLSPKCSCFNSNDEIKSDLGISKYLNRLTESSNSCNSSQNNLKKLQIELEINDKPVLQINTKKLTDSCINYIKDFNTVFEDQKLFVEGALNEFKTQFKRIFIKLYSIERSMYCIHCYETIDFPKIDGLDIYFALNEIVGFAKDISNVPEFRKNHVEQWTFLFELGIKYGNMYIDKLKYTIEVIDELFNSIKANWYNNITTVTSRVEHSIERIIFFKKKTDYEEIYVNERIKYTIKKELEGFKNNVNAKIVILELYKKEVITIIEDIIRIIGDDIGYRARKLQEKRERNELITKQRKFFDDISSLLTDVIDDTIEMDENFSDPENCEKKTSSEYLKEMGDILFEMHKIISHERKQQNFDVGKSNEKPKLPQTLPSIVIPSSDVSDNDNSEK